jgi:RNA-directed DNA polymerase
MIRDLLSRATGLEPSYILKVARTANHRYKTYTIPKKDGTSREIHHPARELKLFQAWLATNIFEALPIHPAAMAYRNGKSILSNAVLHASHNYLLRIDFEAFFPSIRGQDVVSLLHKNASALRALVGNDEDIEIIRQLSCRRDRLTIGAPSSPAISNAVMFDLDASWFDLSQKLKITYSRYADDLYFSTNSRGLLSELMTVVRKSLAECQSPRLFINEKKSVFTSRKRRRLATGLVLTSDKKVSIGRATKRKVKALAFQYRNGLLDGKRLKYLRGFLAYVRSVEPRFLESLRAKYGEDTLTKLLN